MVKKCEKPAFIYNLIAGGKSFLVIMFKNLHLESLEEAILYLSFRELPPTPDK